MTQMKTTGKKVSIIRNRKRQSEEVFQQLRYKLRKNNFILTEKHPDIVISIGGDGMLLSAFHKYEQQLRSGAICWRPYRTLRILYGLLRQ